MAELLDIDAAANRASVSPKTIRRNVTSGRYAGAVRDSRTQKWLIPADSLDRQHDITHAEPVDVAALDGEAVDGDGHLPAHVATPPLASGMAGPVMLSVQHTAHILGISEYAVRRAIERDQLVGYPWGPNGALLVPMAEIRRLAGA